MNKFSISFPDPASKYAYFLFNFHNTVMILIIIILILVYWCLFRIIQDYNWFGSKTIFRNYVLNLIRTLFYFIVHHYKRYMTLKLILTFDTYKKYENFDIFFDQIDYYVQNEYIGEYVKIIINDQYVNRFIMFVLLCRILFLELKIEFFYMVMGVYIINNYYYKNEYDLYCMDINGKFSFSNDTEPYGSDEIINELIIEHFWSELSIYKVKDLIFTKNIDLLLYNYTSNSYFYNGYINNHISKQQRLVLNNNSTFGLSEIFNFENKISMSFTLKNYNGLNEFLIFNESFFESQNFKHSTLFEIVWAIFPTSIILTILIPSLYLLYSLDEELDPSLTIKVIGHHDIEPMNLIIEWK